jgi:peptidoglycan/LPS O-acetylase OafA/YrhL
MKTNNTTQTTNNTWLQTKLWSMSALAVITFFCCVYLIATNKTALTIFAITIAICAVTALVWSVKGLIENIYNELIKKK